MEYYDIYNKRLSRYGDSYQTRIQSKREKEFELYLNRSVYLISFEYESQNYIGSFERYKQDETETLHYLLTNIELDMPNGTILMLPDKNNEPQPWMVYYLENIKASGYNKYIMLRMTHFLMWTARDGSEQTSWAYMYGQENNMLKDELQSGSRSSALYTENLKSSFFIMPLNQYIRKDDYLEIGEDPYNTFYNITGFNPIKESYRVTGYDIQSNKGVEFVTIDPVYERDLTPAPTKQQGESDEDFFWFNGGAE